MEKKVLLSVQDLVVKFHVRGRVLTAIRGISLDIYENESIGHRGQSPAPASRCLPRPLPICWTPNGFMTREKSSSLMSPWQTSPSAWGAQKRMISEVTEKLNEYSKLENGAEIYKQMKCLESEAKAESTSQR